MQKGYLVLAAQAALPLAFGTCWAQAGTDDSQPLPSNVRGAQYPRVSPGGRITFQFKAPAVQKVQVH
jgi:hypothetical protein